MSCSLSLNLKNWKQEAQYSLTGHVSKSVQKKQNSVQLQCMSVAIYSSVPEHIPVHHHSSDISMTIIQHQKDNKSLFCKAETEMTVDTFTK